MFIIILRSVLTLPLSCSVCKVCFYVYISLSSMLLIIHRLALPLSLSPLYVSYVYIFSSMMHRLTLTPSLTHTVFQSQTKCFFPWTLSLTRFFLYRTLTFSMETNSPFTHSISLCLSLSVSLSLCLSLYPSHTFSFSLYPSHTFSFSPFLCLSLSLSTSFLIFLLPSCSGLTVRLKSVCFISNPSSQLTCLLTGFDTINIIFSLTNGPIICV